MFAAQVCSQSISERIDGLEWTHNHPIGWQGSSYPDEWKLRGYPPQDDAEFTRRVDQAMARGERDPIDIAMKEAWKEHDQKANGETAKGPDTIQ